MAWQDALIEQAKRDTYIELPITGHSATDESGCCSVTEPERKLWAVLRKLPIDESANSQVGRMIMASPNKTSNVALVLERPPSLAEIDWCHG